MFSYLASSASKKGNSVLVFTHRAELLRQAGGSFDEFGIEAEYIQAGEVPDLSKRIHVAMVETFHKRINQYQDFLKSRDVIIIDEAHLQNFNKILDYITNDQVLIGATATPLRKGKERCFSENYDDLIQIVDTPDLISLGKLTKAESYGVQLDLKGLKKTGSDYDTSNFYEENKIYQGVVSNYEKHALGLKTILFASNVESSKQVCREFELKGYNAKHIDGNTKNRDEIFEWFDKTDNAILCNCGIATTGFDQKDIKCVILYRATTSLPLFLQMCGRGSRIFPNKDVFKILDFGNNIQRHGFWEQPRSWQLKKKSKTRTGEAAIKNCPKCEAMNYATAKNCIVCDFEFPVKEKEKTQEEVTLELLTNNGLKGKKISELSLNEILILQQSKRFKAPYIWRIVRTQGYIDEYAKIKGYSNGWIWRQNQEDTGFKDLIL